MANPRGQQRDKPYRDALRLERMSVENGEECVAPPGSLRWIARKQLLKAGEDTSAAKEIADRLDGKVPTPVVGDDDHDAVTVLHKIERIIVDPQNPDSESVPPTP